MLQPTPQQQAEYHEPKAPHGRACCVDGCYFAGAHLTVFGLLCVFLQERGGGGKDCWKCKEEASDLWTIMFRDKSCSHSDPASEGESPEVLVPGGLSQGRKTGSYSQCLIQCSIPSATANQATSEIKVTGSAAHF